MIHIYTGDGKGKTTASVGLAIRASATKRVLFNQLIKDGKSSEINVLRKLPNITVKTFGKGKRVFTERGNIEEKANCKKALDFLKEKYNNFEVIVADEMVTSIALGLINEKEVLEALEIIAPGREVILTGRGVTEGLIKKADLVTEMKKIKHYYDKGQKARKGIEL